MFGVDFIETCYTCPLCEEKIMLDDLVFIGHPKEIAIHYLCFRGEIAPLLKNLGGELAAPTYDENNTPHLRFCSSL